MASNQIFGSTIGPIADAQNNAGGLAYKLSDYHALVSYAATGCFNNTFYVDAKAQLAEVLALASKVHPESVAKIALFSRQHGHMKDMPALLCVHLASIKRTDLLGKIWSRVIDNGKMLRNFVQIMRSGVTGRKSFGTAPRRLIRTWLDDRDADTIFRNSVGNEPKFSDILKLVHPKATNPEKNALYGWMLDKKYDAEMLPPLVKQFEAWKAKETTDVPSIPFEMLTALPLGVEGWTAIAKVAKWQWTRMNINTMMRQGVLKDGGMCRMVAERLADREQILSAKVFPYQLMNAFINCSPETPAEIKRAMEAALELSTENVPSFDGKVYVAVDVSGSMQSPVTGHRGTATTSVKCVDVAGLMASVILRRNPNAEIIPFDGAVRKCSVSGKDSIMINAKKLAMDGGSTNCSAPMAYLNEQGAMGDLVIYVSDNESWVDSLDNPSRSTKMVREWKTFKKRNPKAKMVCIDITPSTTSQIPSGSDVLNIAGFGDSVFELISLFVNDRLGADHWCGEIDKMVL
jgi:60 kDa SS-A/Ro ribonucleoprotein